MERLMEYDVFRAPPVGSEEAKRLALRWKENSWLPPRLAECWKSKNAVPTSDEDNLKIVTESFERVRTPVRIILDIK